MLLRNDCVTYTHYMHACVYPYMHIPIHTYIHQVSSIASARETNEEMIASHTHTHIHTYTHTYMYPHIHTSTHTYIHTYIR